MVVVLRVPSLSDFHLKLALIVRERELVVVVEYFQVNRLFVGNCRFPSDLSTSLYI